MVIAGIGHLSGLGAVETSAASPVSLVFTAACGGSGTDSDGNTWTITSDSAESNFDNTKGIHYGTSKVAVSYLNATTSGISGTISQIVVNASGASETSAKLNVTVGGNPFGTQKSLTSSAANYTLTGSASGTIVVSLTQTSAKKALYIKSVVVTYAASVSSAFKVTYDANGAPDGTVPTDDNEYESGDDVTVLGNTGSLKKFGYSFDGWNGNAVGTGTSYTVGSTFSITGNTTLYAKWTPKTLSSIAVKTAPSCLFYGAGESFDPTGLVITATWSDTSTDDLAYSAAKESFSFTPSLSTPLSTSNASVTIAYRGETTSQSISVVDCLKDTLTRTTTGIASGGGYDNWSNKTVADGSGAVYAGQSGGGNDSIQLRSNNSNSGIIVTSSSTGNRVAKITVSWNSNTAEGRTIDIYGKNTAYSAATDLYSAGATQGTKIGSIVCGTSISLVVGDSYSFIGIRSKDGALYLDNVSILWLPKTISSISINQSPTKTDTYIAGETFDPTGLAINVMFSDTTSIVVPYAGHQSDFSFIPTLSTLLGGEDDEVVVTYGGKTVSISITVTVPASIVELITFPEDGTTVEIDASKTGTAATTVLYEVALSDETTSYEIEYEVSPSTGCTITDGDEDGLSLAFDANDTYVLTIVADEDHTSTITFEVTGLAASIVIGFSGDVPATWYTGDTFSVEAEYYNLAGTLTWTVAPANALTSCSFNPETSIYSGTVATTGSEGTITLTASDSGGDESDSVIFTPVAPSQVNSVTLSSTSGSVVEGGEVVITATVNAQGNVDRTVSWTTDDSDVATVVGSTPGGVPTATISAVAEGTTTITAACGGQEAEYLIRVLPTPRYYQYKGNITSGTYMITYNNGAAKNSISSNRLDYDDISLTDGSYVLGPANNVLWDIEPSGDYWTIKNVGDAKYLAATGAGSQAALVDSGTDDKAKWTITQENGVFEIVSKYNSDNSKNANLRRNGTYGFACYSTSTGGALTLYSAYSDFVKSLTISSQTTDFVAGGTFELGGSAVVQANFAESGLRNLTSSEIESLTFDLGGEAITTETILDRSNNGATVTAFFNDGYETVSYEYTITVDYDSPTSITVTPATKTLEFGQGFQLSVSVQTQYADPGVTWEVVSSTAGSDYTLSSGGYFTAGETAGVVVVQARSTKNASLVSGNTCRITILAEDYLSSITWSGWSASQFDVFEGSSLTLDVVNTWVVRPVMAVAGPGDPLTYGTDYAIQVGGETISVPHTWSLSDNAKSISVVYQGKTQSRTMTVTPRINSIYVEESLSVVTSISVGDSVYMTAVANAENYQFDGTVNDSRFASKKYTDIDLNLGRLDVVAGSTVGSYAFKVGNEYLACFEDDNTGSELATSVTDQSSWTVEFSDGKASIRNVHWTNRYLQWNTSIKYFSTYQSTSNQTNPTLLVGGGTVDYANQNIKIQKALIAYADYFNSQMNAANVCAAATGDVPEPVNPDHADFNTAWANVTNCYKLLFTDETVAGKTIQDYLGEGFTITLNDSEKETARKMLESAGSAWREGEDDNPFYCLERAMETYDVVVTRYEKTAFLSNRTPSPSIYIPSSHYSNPDSPLTTTLWIVLASGMTGLAAIGAAYFISKKKRERA